VTVLPPHGDLGVPRWAALRSDVAALIIDDTRTTFAELWAGAARGAQFLRDLGIRPGDRVGLSMRNRLQYIEINLAVWSLGAVMVPFAYRSTQDELDYMVEDAGMSMVFIEEDGFRPKSAIPSFTWVEFTARSAPYTAPAPAPDAEPLEERVLPYTSGTTGRPKAIKRAGFPQGIATHDPYSWLAQFPIASTEGIHLCVAPMYHAQPRLFTQAALDWGHTVVMMRSFDAIKALELIEREGITWISMAPIHFVRLLKLGREVIDRYDLSTVQFVVHSASPVAPEVKRQMMEIFPDALWEMYGGTEGTFTIIGPDEWLRKPGSVGRTEPGRDLAILDEAGNALPAGQPGTIYRHEPSAARRFEYSGAPEATAKAWRGEYFTLGEVGYLDDDGYLFLTDREKDMIVRGGENVSSQEVEAVLIQHPDVRDVAVIGIPDDEYGEAVLAIVETDARVDAAAIIDFCQGRLSRQKCPTRVEFVDAMPREPTGKLRKRYLREAYWKDHARAI
jgi:long-chain acyl-CoA synthetase